MSRRSENSTKVFVGSLPANVTVEDLRKLFEPYGEISECDIANRCGFLHLEDRTLAMKAIEELNGVDFMGGKISVEKGRIKPRRSGPVRNVRRPGPGGPYSRGGPPGRGGRGGPPRGGPRNGFGGGREQGYGGGGDRFAGGYDRPPRSDFRDSGAFGGGRSGPPPPGGSYGGRGSGFGDRGASFNSGFGGERRPFPDERGGFDDRRPPASGISGYDDRRAPLAPPVDRRPLLDQGGLPPRGGYDSRGASGFESRGPSQPDLYSRREPAPKPMGGYGDRGSFGGAAPANGYGSSYGADRYGGAPQGPSGGYSDRGGYGDSYGPPPPSSGGLGGVRSYDSAYPPLPQRGFPGGGPRRDIPSGPSGGRKF